MNKNNVKKVLKGTRSKSKSPLSMSSPSKVITHLVLRRNKTSSSNYANDKGLPEKSSGPQILHEIELQREETL